MRIVQIITTDLAKEKLILEERLETTIHSDLDVSLKAKKIKKILKNIALVESSFIKWQNYTSKGGEHNNEEIKRQNND